MRYVTIVLALASAAIPAWADSSAIAPSLIEPHQTAHQMFLEQAKARGLEPARAPHPATVELAPYAAADLTAEVFGYYPYWSTTAPADLRLDLLSTIAYFSLEIDGQGYVTATHGWPDGDLIDEAHAAGVRVVLCVTNFSPSQQTTLLGSATNRARAIANIVDEVVDGGGDGVNIDFELLPVSQKANFVTFMNELGAALETAIPGSHFSAATPAVDWAGSYDYDKLAAATDLLFIMGYDYHYKGGDPGPVSPLYSAGPWGLSIEDTLDDYELYIAPYSLADVVLGLPLYGYDWPATSAAVPGTKRGNGIARILSTIEGWIGTSPYGPRLFDGNARSPYLTFQKPGDGWHQLWYEDGASMAERFAYAQTRGTAGIGFWALGYTGTDDDVWDEVEDAYFIPGDDDDDDDGGPGRICGSSDLWY
ncbi:MAG: glycosyl hydrolase family 18 protein [Deltaproteobacteria bacterium]|nr:glycosyl hydrolase family 18 protein [Deltaproteobacteria bacterium]